MRYRRFIRPLLACSLLLPTVLGITPDAKGGESLKDLEARMDAVQADLDEATARIETLRTEEENLRERLRELDLSLDQAERRAMRNEQRAVETARNLYMGGSDAFLEVLLSSEDVAQLSAASEYMSRVSETNANTFVELARDEERLQAMRSDIAERLDELAGVRISLTDESNALQARFEDAADEYEALKRKREAAARKAAAAAAAAARREERAHAPSAPASGPSTTPSASGLVCPVDGPNSFIDSWGYPRPGGRSHEGTDVMAAFGTPVVAVIGGTVTYAGYGDSAGNWIVLSGNDGNSYWYMHNRENLVTGGPVKAGELIATVGDTGNAIGGPPHVHFEYHPGGGGPVNPYPILTGPC